MKNTTNFLMLTALLVLFGGTAGIAASTDMETEDTLFVVITTGDAETQMMALVLATQSANQGATVRVLLCSEGGNLALKDYPSPAFAPADRSPSQLLTGLIERGATVEVCGIFLPNRDATQDDLLEGIRAAAPPEVAAFMRNPRVRLFTF